MSKYYLGLDMGTDSIGWAVTDENYKVLKSHGKAMWGIHLFDSGKTAADRRMFRTARRRTDRKKQRIDLLQELFSEEICKVDPAFYQRLEDSKYYKEDKITKQKYTLFNDTDFNDVQYHKEFPTIYHLRSKLIHDDSKYDIRLIYLAVSHIIKHRGHFLFENMDLKEATSFSVVIKELEETLNDSDFNIDFSASDEIEEVLKSPKKSVNDKKKELISLTSAQGGQAKAVCTALAGGTVKLADLFSDELLEDAVVSKFSFKDGIDDDKIDSLNSELNDRMYILEKIKAIYDWSVLTEILNGHEYISDAKINIYDKHKKDLSDLKKVIKKYRPDEYKNVFSKCEKGLNNYVAYSGKLAKGSDNVELKTCSQSDFCSYIGKILEFDGKDPSKDKTHPANPEEEYIFAEIKNKTALPKQVSKDNGVIPYQVHLHELEKILDNASNHYEFLNRIEDGITVKDKIIKLMTFRIPYYVGPLNGYFKEHSWIVRKEPGKIHPWNFENKVNKEETAAGFITRMTNTCTYLVGEKVLAKNSILYSKYSIYNMLNNIRINGAKLPVDVKNKLFSDNYINIDKSKKLTSNGIIKYLISTGYCLNSDKPQISGIDNDIPITMSSYIDFKRILGTENYDIEIADDIIEKIVIFGDSKELLKSYIEKEYHDVFTSEQIKNICRLHYSGWGTLSKKFLTGIYHTDKSTGECISIMSALEKTQDNLMQLLSNSYDFTNSIEEFNCDKNDVITGMTYKSIDKLTVSPSVKRSIWRTSLIVKEIVKVMGEEPAKIFLEMARDNTNKNKGKKTVTRKKQLEDCYKKCEKLQQELAEQLKEKDDNQLRKDKLYLYFTQMGRCAYSGDPIALEDIFDKNKYDIDHIFPQSKTKDDSLDNRVLVKKDLNSKKGDLYPIPSEYRTPKTLALWKEWESCSLISQKKYDRLVRTEEFSADELAGFISRQLVETRQSSKAFASLLKQVYKNSDIVYVKAGNVSQFRQTYELVKCRSVNDYHHAKDAYLNIVVGNVYDVKFTKSPANFIAAGNRYSLNRVFDFNVERDGNVAWTADNEKSISAIKQQMSKNNILFTRYATEQKGGFFKQMPLKKGAGQMPLKTSDKRLRDIEKYGGYNDIYGAYFVLIKHSEKGETIKTIESVPVYIASKSNLDNGKLKEYFEKSCNMKDVVIVLPKIKFNTLFDIDGFKMHLTKRSNNSLGFISANQLVMDDKHYNYAKKIEKYLNRNKEYKTVINVTKFDDITTEENIELYSVFCKKLNDTIYRVKLGGQLSILEKGKEKFKLLSLEEQTYILGECIKLFQCNTLPSDFRKIEGPGSAGKITKGNKIEANDHIKIINQSVTGLFENVTDLAKL